MSNSIGFDMCKGNPGALSFMVDAYDPKKSWPEIVQTELAFKRMRKANIQGSMLYMLWNDCCGRDTEKALEIMRSKDIDDIKAHINVSGGRGYAWEE